MRKGFFQRVYHLASRIPEGQVATYGQIARWLGNPRGARAVGWALRALPHGSEVPWHRVINARGEISAGGRQLEAAHQRQLLMLEGVEFDDGKRVDLARHGWAGPGLERLADPWDPAGAPEIGEVRCEDR